MNPAHPDSGPPAAGGGGNPVLCVWSSGPRFHKGPGRHSSETPSCGALVKGAEAWEASGRYNSLVISLRESPPRLWFGALRHAPRSGKLRPILGRLLLVDLLQTIPYGTHQVECGRAPVFAGHFLCLLRTSPRKAAVCQLAHTGATVWGPGGRGEDRGLVPLCGGKTFHPRGSSLLCPLLSPSHGVKSHAARGSSEKVSG